jgi:hypothetical protein
MRASAPISPVTSELFLDDASTITTSATGTVGFTVDATHHAPPARPQITVGPYGTGSLVLGGELLVVSPAQPVRIAKVMATGTTIHATTSRITA